MRPNFEVFVKTPTILNDSEVEIHEFTKEQMDAINFLEEGKRILVTGSQGTGKSSIAEEVLKRESEKNNSKILFLNSNRLACEEIKFKLEKTENKKKIDFYTFNQIMLNIINNINPQISKEIFKMEFIEKNNYLIKKSIEVLKNNIEINENYKYDLIVFDEIQNCYFYDQFYIFLNLILKNELTNGRYCFLGDFKYQNLVSDQSFRSADSRKFLVQSLYFIRYSPENNLYASPLVDNINWNDEDKTLTSQTSRNGKTQCGERVSYQWNDKRQIFQRKRHIKKDSCKDQKPWQSLL